MGQQPVELILLKQVAGYLATPIFLVGPGGDLLYYNEPAEQILGHRFEETGELSLPDWATMFSPTDSLGRALPPESLPLTKALVDRTPTQGTFWIKGLDGISRHLAVTGIPLEGPGGANVGALAIFWTLPRR